MLSRQGAKVVCRLCSQGASRLTLRTLSTATPQNAQQQYASGRFRSDAQTRINKQPVIQVDGHLAVCEGGGGALGHPIEYIQLDRVNGTGEPVACVYCGLRYQAKPHGH